MPTIEIKIGKKFWQKAFRVGDVCFVSPGRKHPKMPRFVPIYPRPSDTFSQTPAVTLLAIPLATRVQRFTVELFEPIWENWKKRTRVLCPRGTETPRFVPVYPCPGDTFSQTPTVNLLAISLATCVRSITLKLFVTIVLCWK